MVEVGTWRLAALAVAAGALAGGCESGPCAELACGAGAVCVEVGAGAEATAECRCGSETGPACGLEDTCMADARVCVPAAVCGAGTRWAPGQPAFRDATADWGLDALGAQGVRLSVTDIDGDGWADLEVRRGRLGPEDFSGDAAARNTWLLRNTGEGGFEDVTEASGILTPRRVAPAGRPNTVFAWGDVDNDGDLDAYVGLNTNDLAASGEETSEILLNDGAGRFTLTAASNGARRADVIDHPAGASFVDFDRDGLLDLWVPQGDSPTSSGIVVRGDVLFRGDGAGGFTDVSAELGIVTSDWTSDEVLNRGEAHTRAWSGNACDLDGDGDPELLAASYGRSPNHLWQARDGGYVNRGVASGYAYDDDLTWEDNQFARCFCQANPDAEECAGVGAPIIACRPTWSHARDRQPWRLGGNSGATICGDLDNDGDLDLLTTEIRHAWAGAGSDGSEILVNDGGDDPVFSRPGDEALGLAVAHTRTLWDEGHMTAALLDFDNDGWLDVYIGASDYPGNRGLLYHHDGSGLSFTEVPPAEGIDHNRSHGVVFADFDRDGDLDVVVGHSRSRCGEPNDCYETSQVRLFENLAGDGGNFVQLRLEGGPGANRAAIGARVQVSAGGVTQTQEVGGGHGHFGAQNDLVLHFGLGAACEAQVEVRWPDASLSTQTFAVPAGHRFHVVQGEPPRAE